jgi:diadenosine tetraphosphate (Ap4A) HIT family hydrolase
MKKIIDIFNNEIDLTDKCLGCEIVDKSIEVPYGILIETTNFVAVQDIETPIPAFIVITSKKHIKSILDLNKDEYNELMDLCYKIRKSMSKLEDIKDVSIIQKELAPHFHLWLFPRYDWMINNETIGLGYGRLTDFSKIIDYSRKNHKTDEYINKVKDYLEIIKTDLK